ncbi:MAG: pimeloyl-ACP methyl ester esterase BioH [Xanthomonadales bacterium]|nr:pimeloyl-ACP methyl ester esterase BioH [Xanthomonadales bacterium]
MYVERIGHGRPLVLIHGWAMHGGVFAPLVERLSADFELHVIDLPGHGRSLEDAHLDLDDCARRIAEATPPAAWLGWSLGGLVALTGALRHPDSATSLVMLSATPRFVAGDDWPDGVRPSLFSSFADGLRRDYRGTLEQFLALEAFGSDHLRDELRALKQQLFARGEPDPDVLVTGLRVLAETDLRDRLPELACRSLWLGGRRDRLVNWSAMEAAAAMCRNVETCRVDGAGHAPFLSHADEVAARIRASWTCIEAC